MQTISLSACNRYAGQYIIQQQTILLCGPMQITIPASHCTRCTTITTPTRLAILTVTLSNFSFTVADNFRYHKQYDTFPSLQAVANAKGQVA